MGYTSNLHSLMVICVIVMMTEALPHLHPEKALSNTWTHKKSREPADADTLTVPLHIDPKDLVPSHPIRPTANHSISPWTYNITYDDSRFPNRISEAKCSLKGCLNFEGKEDRSLESKPIYHQILFLRKMAESEENYYYKLQSKVIAVGCTCVRPSIQHQQ